MPSKPSAQLWETSDYRRPRLLLELDIRKIPLSLCGMKAVSFGGGRLLADVFPRKELIDCLVTTFVSALHTMSRQIHA